MPNTKLDLFQRLHNLSKNLWWSWNPSAIELFASLDPCLFEACKRNPIRLMMNLQPERKAALREDVALEKKLSAVEKSLDQYLNARTWFDRKGKKGSRIAYFCAEFAIHESLPQYSGGLGVLAGDHLKSASDLGIPLTAIGFLYRSGYYTQEFRVDGSTRIIYPQLDFAFYPVTDTGKQIVVPVAGRKVHAKIWHEKVGRVDMYLLDTDVPQNSSKDRMLTKHLYGGDREYRIQQEILLGVGGVIALDKLGIKPTAYHLNEGHAAFCALKRWADMVSRGEHPEKAKKKVRASTVFTTHTPVPAGNDRFEPKLAWKYLSLYGGQLMMDKDLLLSLGREDIWDHSEEFCMTILALKLADHCNGVAKLHGETSRKMWMKTFGATKPSQVPIGHVTNGIHVQTWLAPEMSRLYDQYLKPKWIGAGPEDNWWKRVNAIPDQKLWETRTMLRARMIQFIRQRLIEQSLRRHDSVNWLEAAYQTLDPNTLTIGFARRFATYKRAPLIFRDAARLSRILNHPKRPIQLVFAGKAHPKDLGGQEFAQEIFRHSRENGFVGKVVILEEYDMQVGRMLTSGCDVWLNNPLRPQEASGTSGMKPPLHGGLNCSILDGWWPEAYNGKNGWAIGDGREYDDRAKQDRYDSNCIYDLLEKQIAPLFYSTDRSGIPRGWVTAMKNSMRTCSSVFNTHRMLAEYWQKFYGPASGAR